MPWLTYRCDTCRDRECPGCPDARDERIAALEAQVADLTMERDALAAAVAARCATAREVPHAA